jgi:hypothetical protein
MFSPWLPPFTCTVKLPSASLPCASVAEHVTVVSPAGNELLEAWSHETGTSGPSTRSVAVGAEKLATALPAVRLNFTGIDWPALALFTTLPLSIGWKKPFHP